MSLIEPITVAVDVAATPEQVWHAFTSPEAICAWNAASADWHTTKAENDLRVGGRFSSRMEAKDGSTGFDFNGVYDEVVPLTRIAYTMEGGRRVEILFTPSTSGVRVTEAFEPEYENTRERQQEGWQAILQNFKRYCEERATV